MEKNNVFAIFFYFLVVMSASSAVDIPDFMDVCKKTELDRLECFQKTAEKLQPYMKTGVPEYNIPKCEPLEINELMAEDIGTLRVLSTNIKTWGCSNFEIKKVEIDMDQQTYKLTVFLPLLQIESLYNVSGKVLMMPVKGDGPLSANLTNAIADVFLQGELYDRDGATYLRFSRMEIKLKVESGIVKLENLFNGDKLLNDIVNETINKNLDLFLEELMPLIGKGLASGFVVMTNNIIKQFTFDQLFPH